MEENLNNLETSIILILEEHRGQAEAIGREDLVRQVCDLVGAYRYTPLYRHTPIHERAVRQTIKHLITQHGFAIGSKGGKRGGYYMCETPDEIDRVAKYFDSIGLCSLFTASKLKKIEMKDYLGQLSLRFSHQ